MAVPTGLPLLHVLADSCWGRPPSPTTPLYDQAFRMLLFGLLWALHLTTTQTVAVGTVPSRARKQPPAQRGAVAQPAAVGSAPALAFHSAYLSGLWLELK